MEGLVPGLLDMVQENLHELFILGFEFIEAGPVPAPVQGQPQRQTGSPQQGTCRQLLSVKVSYPGTFRPQPLQTGRDRFRGTICATSIPSLKMTLSTR